MTIVSSFSHTDMDPTYPKKGVTLLRSYLEYAASGGRSLGQGQVTEVPLNDFEQSVYDELVRRGLRLAGQVGSSRYRIDLVALHPTKKGRFVLAIECDGETYHSAPTARDRDRLRQQQLEALGWRFCRIWSTDWFQRRQEEVDRVMKLFEEAVRLADEIDARQEPRSTTTPQKAVSDPDTESTIRSRGVRPAVTTGRAIGEYSPRELDLMVRWVQSDDRLRTNDEIVAEVARELGFRRRGSAIVELITRAIARVK